MRQNSRRKSCQRRAPYRIPIQGEWLTLNRSTGQGYLLLHDPARGGKTRRYVGRLVEQDKDGEPRGDPFPEAIARAERYLAEHRAGVAVSGVTSRLTVAQLAARFLEERRGFAGKAELGHFEQALKAACDLYGDVPADDFGPAKLRAVRKRLVDGGRLNRKTLNGRVRRIVAAFKWGVSHELIKPDVLIALRSVEGLRAGREMGLREPGKVSPVPEEHVDAILPLVSNQVAAMVQIMRLTGCRCGEIVQLRRCDVDRAAEPWIYRPPTHKTAHRGHDRRVILGPKARAALRPWLLRAKDTTCFSPREAEESRRELQSIRRVTPLNQGNRPGSNRVRDPLNAPKEAYTTASVRRAIHRACAAAGAPRWSPHQLRHSAATRFEREAGWDEARILLGQRSVDVTAIYVERDHAAAASVAERLG